MYLLLVISSSFPNLNIAKSIWRHTWNVIKMTDLENSFSQENHFLACFFHNQVLNHEPLFILAAATCCANMCFPDSIFFVSSSASDGFVGDVGDQIVERWLVVEGCINICADNMEWETSHERWAKTDAILQSLKSSPRKGKFTIVGFFSSTNAFLVNRLKWRMM